MGNGSRIKAAPNGPYLVENAPRLENSKGETLEPKAVMALCRCGRSENKPYCDGTHARVAFSGARQKTGSKDGPAIYEGGAITIHDDRAICAHAAICTGGLASVFKYGEEPWIDPDGAEVEAIKKQVAACPSGALSYSVEGVEHRDFGADPVLCGERWHRAGRSSYGAETTGERPIHALSLWGLEEQTVL